MDADWVSENLKNIFPSGEDEESVWFNVAAWDAYVLNQYRSGLMALLRPQYAQAIRNMARGYLTKSHLDISQRFAAHISFEYLLADYDLNSEIGQGSLIVEYVKLVPPEMRQHVPWAFWQIYLGNPKDRTQFWPRIRRIWEWRSQEATIAHHSADFGNEMEYYAELLPLLSDIETVATLRPLLEARGAVAAYRPS
jgi:hypothetical protein